MTGYLLIFFAITNYAVNSKFLSRYLGKKLKQNYSVSELLDPVKRELRMRSEEHTSELQSLMRISYAVFCLKKKNITHTPLIKKDINLKNLVNDIYTSNLTHVQVQYRHTTNK